MSQRPVAIIILCVLAALAASCASPRSTFYELSPIATGPPATATQIDLQGASGKAKPVHAGHEALPLSLNTAGLMAPVCLAGKPGQAAALSVAVGPVSVPEVVDRPQMVIRIGANRVAIKELERWAAPLQSNIASVVAHNLVELLQTPNVAILSKETSAIGNYRAAIEIQRFDSMPGQAAELDALWTVTRRQDRQTRTGRTTIRESVHDRGYDALVAAHSRALGRLSRDIARAICSFQQESN